MATEKLKFKIELYSTHWKNLPTAQIKINETKIKLLENSIAEIKAASSNPLAN